MLAFNRSRGDSRECCRWETNTRGLLTNWFVLGERVSSASAEFSEPTCGDLPGDTTTTGRLVVDGDGVKGQHASARDADWYAVSLDAGVDYQFDVVDAPPVYLLKIHGDQGTELRTSAIAPDRVYTLSAQSDDHPADTSTTAVADEVRHFTDTARRIEAILLDMAGE